MQLNMSKTLLLVKIWTGPRPLQVTTAREDVG